MSPSTLVTTEMKKFHHLKKICTRRNHFLTTIPNIQKLRTPEIENYSKKILVSLNKVLTKKKKN